MLFFLQVSFAAVVVFHIVSIFILTIDFKRHLRAALMRDLQN